MYALNRSLSAMKWRISELCDLYSSLNISCANWTIFRCIPQLFPPSTCSSENRISQFSKSLFSGFSRSKNIRSMASVSTWLLSISVLYPPCKPISRVNARVVCWKNLSIVLILKPEKSCRRVNKISEALFWSSSMLAGIPSCPNRSFKYSDSEVRWARISSFSIMRRFISSVALLVKVTARICWKALFRSDGNIGSLLGRTGDNNNLRYSNVSL